MSNVLFINKPVGMTSFDVCFKLRKVLNTKKIGHTGTLDPNASGVMIVLYNNATKANQFLVTEKKEYIAKVKLGIETDTLDIDGKIINTKDYIVPERDLLVEKLNEFKGKSIQEVPITSSVKIHGKKLYEYQRQNIEVELPKRQIEVFEIELLDIYEDGFSFKCLVSSGTYIRAIVRDLLKKIDLIGTLQSLVRTSIDTVKLDDCDNLDDVLNGDYRIHDVYELLSKKYECIEYENIDDIYNGKRIHLESDNNRVLITHNNKAIAIYEKEYDIYKSIRGLW